MHFWYLRNLERLDREQIAIAELASTVEWLVSSVWLFDGAALALDAVIRAHGHDYPVRLTYPDYFPSSPPTVRPVGAETRWSYHQYGDSNGPLCLEWGSDTWHPEITGARVLESAYRLLDIENPLGEGGDQARQDAPSRHELTQGQEVRANQSRLYVSPDLRALLTSLPANAVATVKFATHARPNAWLGLVFQVQPISTGEAWHDRTIPPAMKGLRGNESLSTGVLYKTSLNGYALQRVDTLESLASMLQQDGCETSVLTEPEAPNLFGLTERPEGVIIVDEADEPHFFLVLGEDSAWHWVAVYSEEPNQATRQPENLSGLSEKKVGIVGMGSAGSKIAESLARMGVARFYLVDHDLFLPENVVRHALDWRNVAEHKVDGVKDLLHCISPSVEVAVSRLHLTGQESTAAMSSMLKSLGGCDIIIDATANPRVFNILTHVATAEGKPFVWFEVYGGGGGGMIARSRPALDPDPHTMRDVYNWYCGENPAPEGTVIIDYTTEDSEGHVMTASDTDVGIIALHAARFAVDTVLGQGGYPYSLYLIGLAQWWVFDEPFQTIPVSTDNLPLEATQPTHDVQAQIRGIDFIQKLLAERSDGTDTTS